MLGLSLNFFLSVPLTDFVFSLCLPHSNGGRAVPLSPPDESVCSAAAGHRQSEPAFWDVQQAGAKRHVKGPSEPTSHIYKTSCSRSNKPTHPPLHSPLTRSTQLGCQSSQAPPPNHPMRRFVHENGVHCALSDSVAMLIMTTHSGLDSFLPFYTTEGKPVLIALPSA